MKNRPTEIPLVYRKLLADFYSDLGRLSRMNCVNMVDLVLQDDDEISDLNAAEDRVVNSEAPRPPGEILPW